MIKINVQKSFNLVAQMNTCGCHAQVYHSSIINEKLLGDNNPQSAITHEQALKKNA